MLLAWGVAFRYRSGSMVVVGGGTAYKGAQVFDFSGSIPTKRFLANLANLACLACTIYWPRTPIAPQKPLTGLMGLLRRDRLLPVPLFP